MKHFFIILISFVLGLFLIFPKTALALDITNGSQIFEVQCAGCHPHGNNIIRRTKNLKLKTLKRNKMDSLEPIIKLVTSGKNNMSAFQDRLTTVEIENVAAYVLQQAENNWE